METVTPSEYQSANPPPSCPGSTVSKVSAWFCALAACIACIGEINFALTSDFGIGLICAVVVLIACAFAVIGVLLAIVALCLSVGKRGLIAGLIGVAVLGSVPVLIHFVPGPSMGNIH